ncbi:MAG: SAP domain-containing protein [Thermodesulfovibrionia bacterium]|nr:SAP domain-containing protein [Thermodesulfovibrionia bacterium]
MRKPDFNKMSISELKEYCISRNIDITGIGTSSGYEDKNILLSRIKNYHVLNRESSNINYPKIALIVAVISLIFLLLFNLYGLAWLDAIYKFILR